MVTRLLAALAALLLAPAALAACEGTKLPVERTWQLTLPASGPAAALPVTVADETGNVKVAVVAEGDLPPVSGFGGAALVDGDARRLLVGWTGGACDRAAEVRVTSSDGDLRVTVTTTVAPGGCDAVGIARGIVVDLAVRVDPSAVEVRPG